MTNIPLIIIITITILISVAITALTFLYFVHENNKKKGIALLLYAALLGSIMSIALKDYTLQKKPEDKPESPKQATKKGETESENIIKQIEYGRKYIITKDTKDKYENMLFNAGYIVEAHTNDETIYKKDCRSPYKWRDNYLKR